MGVIFCYLVWHLSLYVRRVCFICSFFIGAFACATSLWADFRSAMPFYQSTTVELVCPFGSFYVPRLMFTSVFLRQSKWVIQQTVLAIGVYISGGKHQLFLNVVDVLIPFSITQMPSAGQAAYHGFEHRVNLFAMQSTCSANDFFPFMSRGSHSTQLNSLALQQPSHPAAPPRLITTPLWPSTALEAPIRVQIKTAARCP